MTFEEYQELAHYTAAPADATQSILLGALGLCGESGEVADIIKKMVFHGHDSPSKDEICKELGDVLWYLSALAHAFNLSLMCVAEKNIDKLRARYPEGFSSKRSINRKE
jgi:NTP pyrophosphatase (non-canonical NTP hydrolase)